MPPVSNLRRGLHIVDPTPQSRHITLCDSIVCPPATMLCSGPTATRRPARNAWRWRSTAQRFTMPRRPEYDVKKFHTPPPPDDPDDPDENEDYEEE